MSKANFLKSIILSSLLLGCSAAESPRDEASQKDATATAPMSSNSTFEPLPTEGRYFGFVPTPSILIFSETRDWRHEEGIVGASFAIMKMAKDMGFGYFTTEHSGIFNAEALDKFDVVVFNNMTGDALTKPQEAAFEAWLAQGKGAVLIHGAGDSSHQDWSFYHNEMLGATFVSHPMDPQFQEARIEVLNSSHPVMAGIKGSFNATDEWYTFEAPPSDDFVLLAGLDESTYSPVNNVYGDVSDLRMGPEPEDHPIIWARCVGEKQARIVFTAMGHGHETYAAKEATTILRNALNWAAKKTDPAGQGCSN